MITRKVQLGKEDLITLLHINKKEYREKAEQYFHLPEYAFILPDFPSIILYPRKGYIFQIELLEEHVEELTRFITYGYSELVKFKYFENELIQTKRGTIKVKATATLEEQLLQVQEEAFRFQERMKVEGELGLPTPENIFKKS
jgi:hypothetical protein